MGIQKPLTIRGLNMFWPYFFSARYEGLKSLLKQIIKKIFFDPFRKVKLEQCLQKDKYL